MLRWSALVIRSFGPALAGLAWALRTQRNLQVHAITLGVVVALGVHSRRGTNILASMFFHEELP